MPLLAAQPGDDADQLAIARQVELLARHSLVARPEVRGVARVYSQRVGALRGTGSELWQVRTVGTGRPIASNARAASHASVAPCVATTSQRLCLSHSYRTFTPTGRFLPIGSPITGTPQLGASAWMRASGGQMSFTSCPRRIRPCDSDRMRISCPRQSSADAVWTMRRRRMGYFIDLPCDLRSAC